MQPFLALFAALTWGSGNFTMGVAGRRCSPRITVLLGFGTGLIGSLIFFAIQQPPLSTSSFLWGAAAGLSQGVGWLAFSRGLYLGPISLVAPLAAITTTVSLYVLGILSGDRVSALSVGGALLALCGIVLLSRPRELDQERGAGGPHTDGTGALYALVAGGMFTLQSLALNQAGTGSSSLVVTGAGLGVVVLMAITFVVRPLPLKELSNGALLAAIGGSVIFLGDIAYLYALSRGPLTTASVLGQLHPLFTVLLAQVLLRERLPKPVVAGISCAVVGGALIAFA